MNLKDWKLDIENKNSYPTYVNGMLFFRLDPLVLASLVFIWGVIFYHFLTEDNAYDLLNETKVLSFILWGISVYAIVVIFLYFVSLVAVMTLSSFRPLVFEELKKKSLFGVVEIGFVLSYVILLLILEANKV